MKFGLFYQLQVPRPLDKDQWDSDSEHRIIHEALEQIELADSLGWDYCFESEHHFLEEYSHSSAPEVFLAAAAARTKNIRLGHGIVHMPPKQNHPARVAERIGMLDLVSNGRVEFGTGEGSTATEVSGFLTELADKREAWEEATRECVRMMTSTPYPGFVGRHFSMPERNVIPKPLQRPHPPLWMAAGSEGAMRLAGEKGLGALGFAFCSVPEVAKRVAAYHEALHTCTNPIGKTVNPAVIVVGNLTLAKTDVAADAYGIDNGLFVQFGLKNWVQGKVPPGRGHLHRQFRKMIPEGSLTVADLENTDGLFVGSPATVRKQLRALEETHVDGILFLLQTGTTPHARIMETLELFAKEVMPEFKERHPGHRQWRDEMCKDLKFPIASSI